MAKPILSKKCPKCNKEKDVSEFSKDSSTKTGLKSRCKQCSKEIYEANKEKRKRKYLKNKDELNKRRVEQYHANIDEKRTECREHYRKNRKHIRKKATAWRNNNREHVRERSRRYYKKENEKMIAQAKAYRERNKEKIRERDRKRYWANKKIFNQRCRVYDKTQNGKISTIKRGQRRRALIAGVSIEDFNSIEVFERDKYICRLCGRKTRPDYKNANHPLYPNLDHIIPLSKGGEHSKRNTQCLCRRCNMKKHNTCAGDQLRLFG